MLLLLLGIIVLHVAVLVLLFVSTIVSVSARRVGQGQELRASSPHPKLGPPEARIPPVLPLPAPLVQDCLIICNKKSQKFPSVLQFVANLRLLGCFEKTRADEGVGKEAITGLG